MTNLGISFRSLTSISSPVQAFESAAVRKTIGYQLLAHLGAETKNNNNNNNNNIQQQPKQECYYKLVQSPTVRM
jgi:hypothetical protein